MPSIEQIPAYMLRFGAKWMHHETETKVLILGLTSKPEPHKEPKYAQRVIYRYPDGRVWTRIVEDFLDAYSFFEAAGSDTEPRGYEVSDGVSSVSLFHTEEAARDWSFAARNEHRNKGATAPNYQVHGLYRLTDLWGKRSD